MSVRRSARTTLRRIEQNDPNLRSLWVAMARDPPRGYDDSESVYYEPNNDRDALLKLAGAVGKNEHLVTVAFGAGIHEVANCLTDGCDQRSFLDGMIHKSSIIELGLLDCDLSEYMVRLLLNEYGNKDSMGLVSLSRCSLENGRAQIFTSALENYRNLYAIFLMNSDMDDTILNEIIPVMKENRGISSLDLTGNVLGLSGCEALANWLRDDDCKLSFLSLVENELDNECVQILADSLQDNSTLQRLKLDRNYSIELDGLKAMVGVLGDTSSINAMYLSNHTLLLIGCENAIQVAAIFGQSHFLDLNTHLQFNSCEDKEKVATLKILRSYRNFDMGPLIIEWEMKFLPIAVNWFDKARGYVENDERCNHYDVSLRKLRVIYQFARAMPLNFVPVVKRVNGKRKIGQLD